MFVVNDLYRNGKFYNGNTYKFGITYSGTDYIVKYPKGDDMSVYCEYIASMFIKQIGIPCHTVQLGVHNNIVVDVITDFTSNTKLTLHSFKDTKQSSEDTDLSFKEYTYKDVVYLISKHLKMDDASKEYAIVQFWNMFICDAILGNRDRHWGNWGYLADGDKYTIAPIYDNGACLFPDVNRVISEYTQNPKAFLYDRVFVFPASLFKVRRPDRAYRSNYNEMFSDLRINNVFASSVKKFRESITWQHVFNIMVSIVEPIPNLHPVYKRFYIEIASLRYGCIVLRSNYDKLFLEVEKELKQRGY